MITTFVIFATSFVFVAALLLAITWAIHANTELKTWKERYQQINVEENAAWQAISK